MSLPVSTRPVAARHHLRAQPDAGAVVGRRAPVRAEDLDLAVRLRVADPRLRHLGAGGAGALVAGAQQVGLARCLHVLGRSRDRVAACRLGGAERGRMPGVAAHRLGHGARHAQQVLLGEAVDVAVVGRVALHHAHARAALAAALRALHAAVVEREREAAARLGVQLRHVAAARERALEHAPRELRVDERHSRVPRPARPSARRSP